MSSATHTSTYWSSQFEFFYYPFQPPDHVSHSYDKDSASCLKKSEIAILSIRFAITSLLANKNSRSWEKEFPILVARVSKIEILLKIFKYNAIFSNYSCDKRFGSRKIKCDLRLRHMLDIMRFKIASYAGYLNKLSNHCDSSRSPFLTNRSIE